MFGKTKGHYQYFSTTPGSDITSNERFQEKLNFLGLSQVGRGSVAELKEIYEKNHEMILDKFYDRLMQIDEFKEVIDQHSSVVKLKKLIHKHFMSIFQDELDLNYIFRRRKIAYTHAKIGVLPNWMISAYTLINQFIIPLIVEAFPKDRKKMMDVLLAYDSIVTIDQQLIVETYIEIQAGSIINGLGEIIKYNVQLDQIKNLIQFQERQEQDVLSVKSSMEQLDESVDEIAASVGEVSQHTQSSLKELHNGIDALQNVTQLLKSTDGGHHQVQDNVTELVERVKSVSQLMEFIKGIAEQTNLLALNASIEAARAGEAGKGFAVVAEEVRKLADNTKSSVQSIHNDIKKLLEITNNIDALTKKSAEDLHRGVNETANISSALADLNIALQQQGMHFKEIASTTHQQAAAANEITIRNKNIAENSSRSKDISYKTGEEIYELSKMINHYRTETISKNFIISQEDIIELTITDHLLWRWRIYNLMLGFEQMSEHDISSHKDSRLGVWYYGKGRELLGTEPAYKELEKPHALVHEVAKKAVHAYNAGNQALAEEYLVELADISQIVIGKLTILKQIIVNSKKQYTH
ncbi:methyl-accepting chemotaxis protein [Viridibacillus sp. FSL R5-0477]|uniref:Methyl-accepting chemotaxis sensory transducer n=1 Tax=Viridibacillus arenosi FSL R5-213 TaxID=1227360 RepID=W4F7G8_9BACL|nr:MULTISPECIES: methyl-accepting chemotaxis protein [Viridibacillus]ETT88785.1 methyl-accepting chemotaxis sensory transducer [Viridibacillus arenosi FSL R5-213]OMC79136.1 chemotaxis protein [Viridibacillus sp. FSL H8-0123]OMC83795.1 chemotaxis protein [Viridibacillus sp. FSL H7-0596]OMC88315.1 chemotaxis protein [Viridibacillus arenosi]